MDSFRLGGSPSRSTMASAASCALSLCLALVGLPAPALFPPHWLVACATGSLAAFLTVLLALTERSPAGGLPGLLFRSFIWAASVQILVVVRREKGLFFGLETLRTGTATGGLGDIGFIFPN